MRQRSVLLILPDSRNRFFEDLAYHFEKALRRRNIVLITAFSEQRPEQEETQYKFYRRYGLSGVIYVPASPELALTDRILEDGVPLVVLDRKPRVSPQNFATVAVDNCGGVAEAIKWLHQEYGHERIGFVKGPILLSSAEERFQGYESAMDELNLPFDDDWIFHGDFSRESGYEAGLDYAQRSQERRPSAVFCANDSMAIGFLYALHEYGVNVPGNVSLLGFDGTDDVRWTFPRLTTVSQKAAQMVDSTCSILSALIDGENVEEQREILISPRRILGGSVSTPFRVGQNDAR